MIIQVEYDENGEIKSIAGRASITLPDGSRGTIARFPSRDHQIAEMDTELVRNERDIDGMRQIKEGYHVTGHPHKPTLAPRSARE